MIIKLYIMRADNRKIKEYEQSKIVDKLEDTILNASKSINGAGKYCFGYQLPLPIELPKIARF